jgi:hypothetical protein
MGPYIYLLGFVWQRSAAHSSSSLAEPCVIDRRQSDRGWCVWAWGDQIRSYPPPTSPPKPQHLPHQPPSQRVFVLKSDLSSSVSGWCGDIPIELPQKRQLHAHPRQIYFKLLSPSCSHCLIFSLRPPPVAHLVQSVPLWDETVANFHLKRRRSTAARLSTRPPRLDFLLQQQQQQQQQQHYHPPRRRRFLACKPALAAYQALCDVRETAGTAYDRRSRS